MATTRLVPVVPAEGQHLSERNRVWTPNGLQEDILSAQKSRYVFENMVARDGIEPPTPAFSELRSSTYRKS
jgi:hypothetical protein